MPSHGEILARSFLPVALRIGLGAETLCFVGLPEIVIAPLVSDD